MKFNGSFLKEFNGTDYYKGVKTKKKVKSIKSSKENRLLKVDPIFTYHSLQRLSERVCEKYKKYGWIRAGKYLVKGEFDAGWINPKLITDCILDIKHSMKKDLLYDGETESFAIRGKICIYIVSRKSEIITIYKEFNSEQKKKYRALANRDALILFNL